MDKQSHQFNNPPELADTKTKDWLRGNAQIISMFWNSMESQVMHLVTHLDSIKEISKHLSLLCSGKISTTMMYDRYQEFFRVQQCSRLVTDYFAAFKRVYEEFNGYKLPITVDVKKIQK